MIVDRNSLTIKEIRGFGAVETFVYLGFLITNKGGCDAINRRLAIERHSTIKFTRIWKDIAISQNDKLKLH